MGGGMTGHTDAPHLTGRAIGLNPTPVRLLRQMSTSRAVAGLTLNPCQVGRFRRIAEPPFTAVAGAVAAQAGGVGFGLLGFQGLPGAGVRAAEPVLINRLVAGGALLAPHKVSLPLSR